MKRVVRRELAELDIWKNQVNRKPLILRGARQVGKSTLVRNFAETQGLDLVEINLERDPKYIEAFNTLDPESIRKKLNLIDSKLNLTFTNKKTLLFIDEIQESVEAIQSLRYFHEEHPSLMVIAAGSLLEFTLAKAEFSMPVGRIQYMHLGPVVFSDYIKTIGEDSLAEFLESGTIKEFSEIPKSTHNKLLDLLKSYFVVGGMPEAVSSFATTNNLEDALGTLSSIASTYRDDFGKYNTKIDTKKLQLVFDRLPALVSNQIKYSHLSKEYKSTQLAEAINILTMAKVIHKVLKTNSNGLPLAAESDHTKFKTIFCDIGLVSAKLGLRPEALDNNLVAINQGALAEQFIGQHLAYINQYYEEPELFYWTRETKGSSSELDYVISHKHHIIPIEVKAGKTGTLKSLHYFMAKKKHPYAVRFNTDTMSVHDIDSKTTTGAPTKFKLISAPLYLIDQLHRILEKAI